VNATEGRQSSEGTDELLFSPMVNPTAPGGDMLGERNPDSVLFDVKTLDGRDDPESSARAGKEAATAEEEASGLIDVKKVLAETTDAEPDSPVIERLTTSSSPPSSEPVEQATPDRTRTMLLLFSVAILLVVGGLLATKILS
jgi:hypothetical protein